MKVRRLPVSLDSASSMQKAVRDEIGPDALMLSNYRVQSGVAL